ncbi:MAG: EthD family reductase [Solirubrobacterales bacterium]|nr:EthD family reductase [Solirubrobacterales bacterium]
MSRYPRAREHCAHEPCAADCFLPPTAKRAIVETRCEPQNERQVPVVKITVLYGTPTDPAALDDYCASTHVPLAARTPNVARFEAARVIETPDGSEPPYYRMAELWFESEEALPGGAGFSGRPGDDRGHLEFCDRWRDGSDRARRLAGPLVPRGGSPTAPAETARKPDNAKRAMTVSPDVGQDAR